MKSSVLAKKLFASGDLFCSHKGVIRVHLRYTKCLETMFKCFDGDSYQATMYTATCKRTLLHEILATL